MDESPENRKIPQNAYVSFTTEDLTPVKDIVVDALAGIDVRAKLTKDGPARNQPTVDSCYTDIAACDIYIGLVGHRLGWVPDLSLIHI